MAFRCDICGQAQEPGVKPKRITTKTRHKEYYHEDTGHYTYGYEAVKEISVCPKCFSSRRQ